MSKTLVPIPNQPLRFTDYNEAVFCKKPQAYNYMHQPGDPLRAQFKQIPCGESILCNGKFNMGQWLGQNLVVNGAFTGNPDGWTLTGGWSYFSNNIIFNGSGGSAFQSLDIVTGKTYRVQFTVSQISGGSLYYGLGDSGLDNFITGDGVYSFDVVAGGLNTNVIFSDVSGSADGCLLDNVSVKEVFEGGECWSDSLNSWLIDGEKACHTAGVSSQLVNSTVFTTNKYYKVVIKVINRTSGTLVVLINGNSGDYITSNGTKTQYILGGNTGTALSIAPSTDFDGCIQEIQVYELRKNFEFSLINKDGEIVTGLAPYISYENEFVNISIDGLETIPIYDTIGDIIVPFPHPLPYGCYRILVEDDCAELYSTSGCSEPSEYISNTIKYAESFAGTYLVQGNNNPTNSIKKHAFGFYFGNHFYLVQRLFIGFRKPKGAGKFNKERYSTGIHYRSFFEGDKVWELVFGAVSEIEHDAIFVMINCKEFGFLRNGCLYRYFNITDEYTPEWDTKGILEVVESRIEVMAQGDALISSFLPNVNDFLLTEDEQNILLEQGDPIID